MIEILTTEDFDKWIRKLKDRVGRLRILERIDRLANGNPGDVKPVGQGISELRLTYGPETATP
jgi:putative addiction module killer protein